MTPWIHLNPGQPRSLALRSSTTLLSLTMQLSYNFSRLTLFVLALAGAGMTTPLAGVSNIAYISSPRAH